MERNRSQAAPVSVDVPLISNQDMWMNIALIKQYHENMPKHEAEIMVINYLRRLGIEHTAFKRVSALNNEEKFFVMLLRAAMMRDAIIIIDRPFKIIPHLKDVQIIFDALKKIDDLYYKCNVYDYQWMAEKYGDLCP